MKNFFRLLLCLTGAHDWTSAAQQGIGPTHRQLEAGVPGFYDYATMYCARCGRVSDLSKFNRACGRHEWE